MVEWVINRHHPLFRLALGPFGPSYHLLGCLAVFGTKIGAPPYVQPFGLQLHQLLGVCPPISLQYQPRRNRRIPILPRIEDIAPDNGTLCAPNP